MTLAVQVSGNQRWRFETPNRRNVMKQTAILHIVGTVAIGAGIVIPDQLSTLGLFVVGAIFIVAGIVLARRNDTATAGPVE